MRVKIPKYAGGGLAFVQPNFVIDTPTPSAPITKTPTAQAESKNEGIIDDDIYKELLKTPGLTSDVNNLINELTKQDYYTPAGLSSSTNTNRILKLIGKVTEIRNNKKYWDDAVTAARDNGSFAETAISSAGELFYMKPEGGIGTTTLSQYKKDPTKYPGLLSVAELLQMREKNPNLAFDTKIFGIADSSVGMDKVTKDIQLLFATLTEYSQSTERHLTKEDVVARQRTEEAAIQRAGRKPTREELEGLRMLKEMADTPGEYLKVNLKESRKGRNLDEALKYIIASLGPAEKKKLELAAITNGYSRGEEMVAQMLVNQSGGITESTIAPEKESAVRDVAEEKGQKSLTPFQLFHNERLLANQTVRYNDPETGISFVGTMTGISPIISSSGDEPGMATLGSGILTKLNYGNFLNTDKISIGDRLLKPYELDKLIYDGRPAAKVYAPAKPDGSLDYEALDRFNAVYAEYEANKNVWSVEQIEDFFRRNKFRVEIEEKMENGRVVRVIGDNSEVRPFLLLHAYTNDASGLTKDNPNAIKMSKEEEELIKPKLESIWTFGTGKNAINITPDKNWHKERVYKTAVFIPYRPGSEVIVDAMSSQGPLKKVSQFSDVQRNVRGSSNMPLYIPESSVLKNE